VLRDGEKELALLSIDKKDAFERFSTATLDLKGTDLRKGTDVYAVGFPAPHTELAVSPGQVHSITRLGPVAKLSDRDITRPTIRFAGNTFGGNSGGGLFAQENGSLLGIVGVRDHTNRVAWAYPVEDVRTLLSQL
jgi:hypothetical protein